MNSTVIKLLGGVAVAGLIATGGSAFTAAGVTTSTNAAKVGQFIGGEASQEVYGAILTNIEYEIDAPATTVTGITLTFAGTAEEIAALDALEDLDAANLTVVATVGGSPVTFTPRVTLGASNVDSTGVTTATASYDGDGTAMTDLVVTVNGDEVDLA